jgi:hypothetical protein
MPIKKQRYSPNSQSKAIRRLGQFAPLGHSGTPLSTAGFANGSEDHGVILVSTFVMIGPIHWHEHCWDVGHVQALPAFHMSFHTRRIETWF